VERFAHISAEIARLSQQQESEQAGLDGASKAVQHYQGTGKLEVVAAKAEGMARGAREREVVGEPAGAELKPTRGAVKMARVQLKSAGAELAEFQVKMAHELESEMYMADGKPMCIKARNMIVQRSRRWVDKHNGPRRKLLKAWPLTEEDLVTGSCCSSNC